MEIRKPTVLGVTPSNYESYPTALQDLGLLVGFRVQVPSKMHGGNEVPTIKDHKGSIKGAVSMWRV